MIQEERTAPLEDLPEFLRVSIEKGVLDEKTARRIEIYRRTRGMGQPGQFHSLLSTTPDPTMTFAHFVRCKGNAFAVDLARIVAAKAPLNLPYNPLYIYADVGLGKTHLLSAIANEASDRETLLANTVDLVVEYGRATRFHFVAELREWLISKEILLLDDIQLCEGREELQLELFSVLNHMMRSGRWLVISSDVPPNHLAGVESRLLSRLGGGVIVSLQMGDKLERIEMLRHFLQEHTLPADVLDYLAVNVTDNVRQLKAVVSQLLAVAQNTNSEVTVELAREVADVPGKLPRSENQTEAHSGVFQAVSPDETAHARTMAHRFKEMLSVAETEEEQALAIQIALGERIRQLRKSGNDRATLTRLEQALERLREGDMEEAIRCLTA
jgi:chromosomal replication initiator protein DnaA